VVNGNQKRVHRSGECEIWRGGVGMFGYSLNWRLEFLQCLWTQSCGLRVGPGLWFSFNGCYQHHHRHPNRPNSSFWRYFGSADSLSLAIFGPERHRRYYHQQRHREVRAPSTTIYQSPRTWIAYGAAGKVPHPHCIRRLSVTHLLWWRAV